MSCLKCDEYNYEECKCVDTSNIIILEWCQMWSTPDSYPFQFEFVDCKNCKGEGYCPTWREGYKHPCKECNKTGFVKVIDDDNFTEDEDRYYYLYEDCGFYTEQDGKISLKSEYEKRKEDLDSL